MSDPASSDHYTRHYTRFSQNVMFWGKKPGVAFVTPHPKITNSLSEDQLMTSQSVRKSGSVRKSKKPKKPHPDFPLTPHASGVFCKKIRGRQYYFTADPDEALSQYNKIKDDLLEGRDPRKEKPGESLGWLCNAFMDSRKAKLEGDEITQRTLDDYHATCKRMLEHFGKNRRLESLGPLDFGRLKAKYTNGWGPVTVKNEIGRANVVLRYAYDIKAVPSPIHTGPDFKRPTKKTLRRHRNTRGRKEFSAEQVHAIMAEATVHVRAMVHLGLNCAYGNTDCGSLEIPMVDFDGAWLAQPRNKTGVERDAWLWPETIDALKASISERTEPKSDEHAERFFITKYGNDWRPGESDSRISKEFTKLTKKIGIHSAGVSFYALRHTFQTVGGNSRDQIAVDRVFGHEDTSAAGEYRESIDPQRIIDVCSYVRDWWLAGKPKGGAK